MSVWRCVSHACGAAQDLTTTACVRRVYPHNKQWRAIKGDFSQPRGPVESRAPDHVGEAVGSMRVARRLAVDALVVEDVAELPLHEARDVLARLRGPLGGPESLLDARRTHRVHRRPEVAPREVQWVRAAIRRPPAANGPTFSTAGSAGPRLTALTKSGGQKCARFRSPPKSTTPGWCGHCMRALAPPQRSQRAHIYIHKMYIHFSTGEGAHSQYLWLLKMDTPWLLHSDHMDTPLFMKSR